MLTELKIDHHENIATYETLIREYQKKAANEAAQRQKIAVVYYCVIRLQQTHHW